MVDWLFPRGHVAVLLQPCFPKQFDVGYLKELFFPSPKPSAPEDVSVHADAICPVEPLLHPVYDSTSSRGAGTRRTCWASPETETRSSLSRRYLHSPHKKWINIDITNCSNSLSLLRNYRRCQHIFFLCFEKYIIMSIIIAIAITFTCLVYKCFNFGQLNRTIQD